MLEHIKINNKIHAIRSSDENFTIQIAYFINEPYAYINASKDYWKEYERLSANHRLINDTNLNK